MATAKQIAEWIVHYSVNDLGAPVDPMSMEKLIYYAQAFHLALHDAPLYPDEVLAWQKGPVVPAVYSQYAVFGWSPIAPSDDECGFRRLRPGIPIECGHAFRSKAATCSDEGGRGVVAGMRS